MKLLDSVVAFGSRTQGTVALSSGEAELYAIGQGTSETLFVKNLLMEAKLVKKINITIHTDSTAGKSMATRLEQARKLSMLNFVSYTCRTWLREESSN